MQLVGAVQGYLRYLKDDERRSAKSAADSRVRDARALEIELRIAERSRELIPVEDALNDMAELAGMVERCDFEEQTNLHDSDDARFRPDMIVRLPQGRSVVVDAKTVLDGYLDAVGASDDEERQRHLKPHVTAAANRAAKAVRVCHQHLSISVVLIVIGCCVPLVQGPGLTAAAQSE